MAEARTETVPGRFRGILQRFRVAVVLLCLLLVGLAVWNAYWFFRPTPVEVVYTRAWYTVDEGANWFEDEAERVPPFDHAGKQAVRLHLFSCDGGKSRFVGYMERLPDSVMKKYHDTGIDPATVDDDVLAGEGGWLVKRRGDAEWINSKESPEAWQKLKNVRCPDGGEDPPTEIFPNNPR